MVSDVRKHRVGRTLDGRPLDLLAHVFLLLGLERQFDKDLLQLFVDIVDAELRDEFSIPSEARPRCAPVQSYCPGKFQTHYRHTVSSGHHARRRAY